MYCAVYTNGFRSSRMRLKLIMAFQLTVPGWRIKEGSKRQRKYFECVRNEKSRPSAQNWVHKLEK